MARFERLEDRALLTSVAGDFNGDGIADLAIGNPNATVSGASLAGSVQIIYGTVPSAFGNSDNSRNAGLTGLSTNKNLLISKANTGFSSTPKAGEQFGAGLAAADFNGDGIADLAIGVPGQNVGGASGAGAVYIVFGSRGAGIKTAGAKLWTQNSIGIQGTAESGDRFGSSLAAGDFNDDHRMDLAVGVPDEAVGSIQDAGAVNVIYGAPGGLAQRNNQLFAGLNSGAADGDILGTALAAGDFNADGFRDLAIGAPGRTTSGNLIAAGAVDVLYGTRSGLQTRNMQIWTVGSGGVQGTANAAGQFGASLAAGDFNDDSRSDLAIGAPGENITPGAGGTVAAGAVHVLFGSSSRLTSTSNQVWSETTTGITNSAPSAGDQFGASVAVGKLNGDRNDDLAIGAPGAATAADTANNIPSVSNAGTVSVLYSAGSTGLGTTGAQIWNQNTAGIVGGASDGTGAATGERFGANLALGDFNGDRISDLAAEAPGETLNNGVAGSANVIFGSAGGLTAGGSGTETNQFWLPTNVQSPESFLATNKTKPGIVTLPDGLQYQIITKGKGAVPTLASQYTVNYTGMLTDGTVFDSSAAHGGPATFGISGLIPGFSEALSLMQVGDHWKVFIPSNLAYGAGGNSGAGIGPNAVLIFDLEVLSISSNTTP
ncbi:MAG TPA: FKBP-type peptidyl-prolyl cis-trans isomerase [Pirellulales bacterium]